MMDEGAKKNGASALLTPQTWRSKWCRVAEQHLLKWTMAVSTLSMLRLLSSMGEKCKKF